SIKIDHVSRPKKVCFFLFLNELAINPTILNIIWFLLQAELERYKRLNMAKKVTGCASAMTACGDSALLGVGLGAAASGAVAATVLTLQTGLVSAGIVAIPISLATLFVIWVYVFSKPHIDNCLEKEPQ
ncbi:hypothetical protein ANCCAN_25653, partial [Ancylostoma caninum]